MSLRCWKLLGACHREALRGGLPEGAQGTDGAESLKSSLGACLAVSQ